MKKTFFSPKSLVFSAALAALYAAVTLLLQPLSYGPLQFRIAEAFTLLPVLFPQAIPGLTLGCFLANLIGSPTPWDVVFGTMATFLAAISTYALRHKKISLAALPPVLFNAVIISCVLYFTGHLGGVALSFTMLTIGLGQGAVCYLVGIPLISAINKLSLERYL